MYVLVWVDWTSAPFNQCPSGHICSDLFWLVFPSTHACSQVHSSLHSSGMWARTNQNMARQRVPVFSGSEYTFLELSSINGELGKSSGNSLQRTSKVKARGAPLGDNCGLFPWKTVLRKTAATEKKLIFSNNPDLVRINRFEMPRSSRDNSWKNVVETLWTHCNRGLQALEESIHLTPLTFPTKECGHFEASESKCTLYFMTLLICIFVLISIFILINMSFSMCIN